MRLDKYLAEAAVATRKITRNYVKEGMVTVNHQQILNPAAEIDINKDDIRFLGNKVIHTGKVYYMFHKPRGCITARKDESCKTVLDYFDVDKAKGIFPIGRLDKDTEGLLLLTNDGEFDHKLMHPNKHVEKTYYFWAFGSLDLEGKERLTSGVLIGEYDELARAIRIEIKDQGTYQELKDRMNIVDLKEIRINPFVQPVISGFLTISEGRKHQVKRMLKAVGCYVVYLKRVSIGGLMLDETLEKGQYRELTAQELKIFDS